MTLQKYFVHIGWGRWSWLEPIEMLTLDEQSAYLEELKQTWLEKWSQFRTTDWTTELEYPEYTAKEVGRFLRM